MRTLSAALSAVVAVSFACAPPKPKVPINVGLALAQGGALTTGNLYTDSANLALKHITEAGGMRGNGVLTVVTENTDATAASAQAAVQKMIDEKKIKAGLVVTSSETIALTAAGPAGAGIAAAGAKTPLICIGCTAPDFECTGLHALFGATVTGADPTTCLSANPLAGTIDTKGYVYRMTENNIPQGAALAQMALADAAAASQTLYGAGYAVDLSFGKSPLEHPLAGVRKIVTDAGKTYVRTTVHSPSPAAAMKSQADWIADVKAGYTTAIAPDMAANNITAVFINTLPANILFVAEAYQMSAVKPKLYFAFTGFSSEVIASAAGPILAGAKGVNYAIAGGPSPGTFVDDYAALANVPAEQVRASIYTDGAYDAVTLMALAIYATGVEDPTPEEVKAKLDTLHDPAGEVIGYGEFKKAKGILDGGGTINYEGVSGKIDWDSKNGVKSPLGKWQIELDGTNAVYKTL